MPKRPENMKVVTNPNKLNDGFGENLKLLMLSVMYAEFNDCKFVYSPFKQMEGNYSHDPEFSKKKEILVNFIHNFENVGDEPHHVLETFELLRFFHLNVEQCSKSKSLQVMRLLFRAGKPNPFDDSYKNIAIHIRRMNKDDYNRTGGNTMSTLPGTDTPNELYLGLIQQLRASYSNAKFHIYSQGQSADFNVFNNEYTVLHINEPLEDTFTQMVLADILVAAPSALSYTAAFLSVNTIYYIEFCNLPFPNWNIVTGYKSSRSKHEFLIPMLTPVYYDPYTDQFQVVRC